MYHGHVLLVLGCLVALTLPACSEMQARRTAFETGQNIRQTQCVEQLDGNCTPRLEYEDYQQQRDALKKPSGDK